MIDARSLPSAVSLEAVLRKGREELRAGRIEGALRTFDAALRIKPTYAPAWRAKGSALRAAGKLQGALDCYAEALRHEPEDEASWFGLAVTLRDLHRPKEEVEAYDELLRRSPRNIAAWMNRGIALHEGGDFAGALACYDRILAIRPEVPAAWSNRGAALLRLRRFEEAVRSFDEALGFEPGFADAAANRRAALAHLGREEPPPPKFDLPPPIELPPRAQPVVLANLGLPAIDAFRRAPPDLPEEYAALGTALLDGGNTEAAAAAFSRAASGGVGSEAGLGRLLALEMLATPSRAEEAARLLAAFPHSVRIAVAVARFREASGDPEGAVAALAPVLDERPHLVWIWNWKGLLEMRVDRVAEARKSFERATAGNPQEADAWANLGASAHRGGDDLAALAALDRALEVDPKHVIAWNNRGVVLASLGRGKEADQALRTAASTGGDVRVAFNRASLVESQGQYRAALKLFQEILESTPDHPGALAGRRRATGHLGAQARSRPRKQAIAPKKKAGGEKRKPARATKKPSGRKGRPAAVQKEKGRGRRRRAPRK